MRSTVVALGMAFGLFVACRGAADAALKVCNATSEPATVAIAIFSPAANGAASQSEGWFQINAGACQLVVETALDLASRYYLFAKAHDITWSGDPRKATDAPFCINDAGRFFYTDRVRTLCTGAGDRMVRFIEEPIQRPDWTIDLN